MEGQASTSVIPKPMFFSGLWKEGQKWMPFMDKDLYSTLYRFLWIANLMNSEAPRSPSRNQLLEHLLGYEDILWEELMTQNCMNEDAYVHAMSPVHYKQIIARFQSIEVLDGLKANGRLMLLLKEMLAQIDDGHMPTIYRLDDDLFLMVQSKKLELFQAEITKLVTGWNRYLVSVNASSKYIVINPTALSTDLALRIASSCSIYASSMEEISSGGRALDLYLNILSKVDLMLVKSPLPAPVIDDPPQGSGPVCEYLKLKWQQEVHPSQSPNSKMVEVWVRDSDIKDGELPVHERVGIMFERPRNHVETRRIAEIEQELEELEMKFFTWRNAIPPIPPLD